MKKQIFLFWTVLLLINGIAAFILSVQVATGTIPLSTSRPGQELAAQERELAGELLRWDLQLEGYKYKYNLLEAGLQNKSELTKKMREDLAQTKLLLSRQRHQLGNFLSFTYRYGQTGYLSVFLGVNSFHDFISKCFYLAEIAGRQAGLFRDTRLLAEEEQLKLIQLEKLQKELEQDKTSLAGIIENIQKTRRERSRLLEEVRRQSGELAMRLLSLESQWQKVFTCLLTIGQKISSDEQLIFDPPVFANGKLRTEINATALNRLFSTAGGENAELSATIIPGAVVINGLVKDSTKDSTKEVISFSLRGSFTPISEGRRITFSPEFLEINGIPVEKGILSFLSSNQDLSWDLTQAGPLKVSTITSEKDKIVLTFSI